jgi:hypothetical protein
MTWDGGGQTKGVGWRVPRLGYPESSDVPSRRARGERTRYAIAKVELTVRNCTQGANFRGGRFGQQLSACDVASGYGPERREGVPQEREADAQDVEDQSRETTRRQGARRHRGELAQDADVRRLWSLSEGDGEAGHHAARSTSRNFAAGIFVAASSSPSRLQRRDALAASGCALICDRESFPPRRSAMSASFRERLPIHSCKVMRWNVH